MQVLYSDEKSETKNTVLKMMYVQHACQSNISDPLKREVDIEIVRVLQSDIVLQNSSMFYSFKLCLFR